MKATFTKKESAWLERLEKTLDAAPRSLMQKVSSYTIGDDNFVLYDKIAFDDFYNHKNPLKPLLDVCSLVEDSNSEIKRFTFPFLIESTAG